MNYNLKKLETTFAKIAQNTSKWDAFTSILDFSLIPYRFYPTGEDLRAAHQQLLSWPDKEHILEFMTEIAELQPEGFGDPLGEFYMLHLSNGKMGQYFTPENITDMMAQMNIGCETKAGEKVLDPACGSGRSLLSAGKLNRNLQLYGADLDGTCCKMAVLNMLLNSLTGEIAHMNSLSNEFFRGYECRTKLIDGHYYPYFLEFTDPERSYIWLHTQPSPDKPSTQSTEIKKEFADIAPSFQQKLKQGSLF
jgi:type I restriction enzyme M protein